MNVIIGNKYSSVLANLDIDVIKSITGEYTADEIVEMFKNFFYGRMIIDITAIKDYLNISNVQKLSIGLDTEKLIFLLPETEETSSSIFLSKLISMGIYNFTTNLDGVKYLLDHPNAYKDVAHIQQLNDLSATVNDRVVGGLRVLGIKNVTDHAGTTTLIYMLKKILEEKYSMSVIGIEIGTRDFNYFNNKNGLVSTSKENLNNEIMKYKDASLILVDLNNTEDDSSCGDVLYLLEPSTIKLNKLMRIRPKTFSDLQGKKIILNKSALTNKDVNEFENEANTKVFYNLPSLDDRAENKILSDLLGRLGVLNIPDEEKKDEDGGGLFGLFKK